MVKTTQDYIRRFNRHHPFNAALAISLHDAPETARALGLKIGYKNRVTVRALAEYLSCDSSYLERLLRVYRNEGLGACRDISYCR